MKHQIQMMANAAAMALLVVSVHLSRNSGEVPKIPARTFDPK